MRTVVISQPMFFPWVGMFEQIRLADVYVHYDDVQFSKGSFVNRVQLKTNSGSQWLTIPLRALKLEQRIDHVAADESRDWRGQHRARLLQLYAKVPFCDQMRALVDRVYGHSAENLADFLIRGLHEVCTYYSLGKEFHRSSKLAIGGSGSQRVLDIVRHFCGDVYVTGHGARHYLDHELFERHGIRVEYMNYERAPYPQLHGPFDPHVSILDLIGNVGQEGRQFIRSGTTPWKEFVNR